MDGWIEVVSERKKRRRKKRAIKRRISHLHLASREVSAHRFAVLALGLQFIVVAVEVNHRRPQHEDEDEEGHRPIEMDELPLALRDTS